MFLAHQKEVGGNEWLTLVQSNHTKTLVNRNGSIELEHNLCLHQGTRLRQGHGHGLEVVCPMHGWAWDNQGQPSGNGCVGHSRATAKCENKNAIPKMTPTNWSGFLFEGPVQLGVDISGDYKRREYRVDTVKANFIAIMNLCLDIDHHPSVHPTTYQAVGIDDVKNVEWRSWQGGSAQLVRGHPLTDAVWDNLGNAQKTFNFVGLAIYPFTFLRYIPGAVMITVVQPKDDAETDVHVFKYVDRNYSQEAQQISEGVLETSWQEDRQAALLMEPGWRFHVNNLDQEKLALKEFLEKSGLT